MGRVFSSKGLTMALIAAIACAVMGLFAIAPQQAYADELVAGSVVDESVSGPEITSCLSTSTGKLTVIFKAYSDIEGYECQIARDGSFSNNPATLKLTSTKVVLSGLAKGKKYFVRARAYATIDGVLTYSAWSSIKSAKIAIKNKSTKISGVWKITGSNIASLSTTIKYNKRISSRAKATLTFKPNGTIILTDYTKKKYNLKSSWGKWLALSKTSGYTVLADAKAATIKVKGKKLTLKSGSSKIYCARI